MRKFAVLSTGARFTLILFMFTLSCRCLLAQKLQGTLYDGNTNETIPYASAGIKSKSRGGIADRNGFFSIDITGLSPSDSVIFSHIGYIPQIFQLGDLDLAKNMDIRLKPRERSLATVTVTAEREMLILGSQRPTNRFTGWGDYSSSRGRTRGLLLEPKEYPVKAVSFECRIKNLTFDSVKVRLNILGRSKDSQQLQHLLQHNIYFNIHKDAKWVTVDLTPYNIVLTDTVVLALEWVDSWAPPVKSGRESYQFTIALSKDHGYFYERNTPNEKPVLRQSMELPVMYLKGYRVTKADK